MVAMPVVAGVALPATRMPVPVGEAVPMTGVARRVGPVALRAAVPDSGMQGRR